MNKRQRAELRLALSLLLASTMAAAGFCAPLEVYPKRVKVLAGKTVRFTAVLQGDTNDEFTPDRLEWTAGGGAIDHLGTFHAGRSAGIFPVTVRFGSLSARATVQVVSEEPVAEYLPGWIFIRRWSLRPRRGDVLALHCKAVVNGQTIRKAAIYAIGRDGSERLLREMPARHRKRCHFRLDFDHRGVRWIAVKAFDGAGRVVAEVRRLV